MPQQVPARNDRRAGVPPEGRAEEAAPYHPGMEDVEVEVRMAAPPAAVWALLRDPTRMGEWSPECVSGRWLDGASGSAPGARFKGSNRLGWRRWSTTCTVIEFEEGEAGSAIAWDVAVAGMPVARWAYRIRPDGPDGAGSVVTESFSDRRGGLVRTLGGALRGVRDVRAHNQVMMNRTLEAVRVAAETAVA